MHANDTEKALTLLTKRLDRLEKQNRWLVRTAWILGAVLFLVVTLGAEERQPNIRDTDRTAEFQAVNPDAILALTEIQDVVRTKNLQILDDEIHLRADLKLVDGEPMLSLYDKEGNARVHLTLLEGEPRLELFNEDGINRVRLNIFNGNPGLWLYDKDGVYRANLSLTSGKPWLSFRDGNGALQLKLDSGLTGSTGLAVYGLDGTNSYFP